MWRAFNSDGTLTYNFVESVEASYNGYFVRVIGGAMFLLGMLLMAYNMFRTLAAEEKEPVKDEDGYSAETQTA
jgi:cytochrome c oxidase cbb3-type subunit 1